MTVTAIPAGLWVRRADAAPLPLLDLGFGVPVEAARPIVLVGAPGERVPHLNELVTFFEVLSPVIRESAVLVPYGQDPDACAALAQSLADRLGIVVRAYHALPHYTTDGTRGFAVWGEEGRPERLTDTPERVYVRASAGPAHRKTGVRERGLMDAATKAMFIHRVPRKAFAAEVPDAGDRPEDFDDLDPVAFEVPVAPSMWPTAAPVAGETPVTAGVVSVDAWGVMRPAGPWPGTAPRPGASPRLATQDREPVASVSADARPGASVIATLFPTTASTVLPQTRSATRTVGMPVKAGHPGTPAAAPYVWEAVGSAGAPPVPSPVGPLAPATEQERTEPPRRTPHEIVPPARPRPDVPDRVPAEPHRVAGNPLEWPEVRSAATAHDRDPLASAVLPDAAISRAEALPEVRTRVSQEAPVSEGPRTAPHSPDAAVPGAETAPDAVAAVPEAASRVAPDIGLSPGPAAAVPDALPEAPPVPADTAASPDAVPSVPPESRAPVASQRDYDRRWLAERMSTPEERHAFRTSLGWRYDAAVRSVARLLAEHPGLRGAATDDALMTELAAVWVFVSRDQAELVESIRGGGGEGNHALAVCAAAGLRRLPSLQGVVVRGGPRDASAADAYRTGEDLVEAAPLIACDDIGDPVPGAVEILIWSATARRLSGFVEDRAMPEVVFLPGTVFHVLAVDPPLASAAPGPRRVLLAEVPATKTGPGREKWIARVTARLKEAAANRPARSGGTDDRFAPLPGDPVRSMR